MAALQPATAAMVYTAAAQLSRGRIRPCALSPGRALFRHCPLLLLSLAAAALSHCLLLLVADADAKLLPLLFSANCCRL